MPLALAVFTASGFAGLIYESIWSHYLKLFLGHAAYAQTLVLAIFMGGMALGAWLASRLSSRWRDPLLAYAVIEALIGVAALVFHPVFVATTGFAFERVIPTLGDPSAVHAFKWSLGALLILPQSVLLGMTFPLMTGGVLRVRPERAGYAVAMLYFTNSLGAAVGVLASGFYFISTVGLPGTLTAAAVVNLAVAAAVVLLPGRRAAHGQATPPAAPERARIPLQRLLLVVAALTGLSSFMYEVGWIRMLALVLGSSTHAFELMLSAFILGIAFGGLWVRRRIEAAGDTVRLLGWVQLAMGLAALGTLPVYGLTFGAMEALLAVLARSEAGYSVFNVASHALCLAVMFPAAFCAGMTLPLATVSLLRRGAGERAIGQVYAVNTAGAIVGVLLAVHLGFTLLGLKGLIVAGAAIDLALGVALLRATGESGARRRLVAPLAAVLGVLAVAGAALLVQFNAELMASGVYRRGWLLPKEHGVLVQLDGKTTTVSVTGNQEILSLRSNGKSDGAVRMDGGPPTDDEITMTLLGALPQFLAPEARRVANIGFGTGMTAHVLLASPRIERLDTIEIEPAIVQAAGQFQRRNWRAFQDPRGRVHYDDAKTYFSARRERYDVIVSEPSNPWVSGIAGLFSTEFYGNARRYLNDGGLFVQWLQLYEMTPALLASVIAALDGNFSDYEFWLSNNGDMLIVAVPQGRVPAPDARALGDSNLRAALEPLRIANLDDLALHRFGGRAALAPYFAAFGARANSDYFPVLEMQAPQARFMGLSVAPDLIALALAPVRLLPLFDERARQPPDPRRLSPGKRPWWQRAAWIEQAHAIREYVHSGSERYLAPIDAEFATSLVVLRAALVDCRIRLPDGAVRRRFADLAQYVAVHLSASEARAFWDELVRPACEARLTMADRQWLQLHRAVASGKPGEILAASGAILESEPDLQGRPLAHAVAAQMAGQLASGESTAALATFDKYRRRLRDAGPEWEPVFRLLAAQAMGFGIQ